MNSWSALTAHLRPRRWRGYGFGSYHEPARSFARLISPRPALRPLTVSSFEDSQGGGGRFLIASVGRMIITDLDGNSRRPNGTLVLASSTVAKFDRSRATTLPQSRRDRSRVLLRSWTAQAAKFVIFRLNPVQPVAKQFVSGRRVQDVEGFVGDETVVEVGEADLALGAAVVDVYAGEAVAVRVLSGPCRSTSTGRARWRDVRGARGNATAVRVGAPDRSG